MTEYSCDNCKKSFTQKSRYDAHKNRKRPCKQGTSLEESPTKEANEVVVPAAPHVSGVVAETLKPVLKWVGGKTQILENVLSLFPTEIKNYHEPFLGGGSVLLGLLSRIKSGAIKLSGRIYASDLNANLIGLYQTIQSRPVELIAEGKRLVEEYRRITGTEVNRKPTTLQEATTSPESYYFWIRSTFNNLSKEDRATPAAAAMLLFLNKTCFRGLYREGPNGFNVPYGNYRNPSILEEEHIMAVSEAIKDVVFAVAPYTESLKRVQDGDFVYLDPPYAPETGTSFVGYTSDGFALEEHNTLFKSCHAMQDKNIRFLMSNADVTLVKESFPVPTYSSTIISCRRAIHAKNPESKTNELLITNDLPN